MAAASGTAAQAACERPGVPLNSVFDFVPLASGTAVSSIIATISSVNTSSLAQSTALVSTPANPKPDQQGGGQWSRVIAGTVETDNNTATTGTAFGLGAGSAECRSTTKLDFIGTQAGMDIGRFNFNNGGNIHWGFTAGYFDVSAKDKTPAVGTFSSDNQIPFAGLYLALSSGNFAIDAQVRGDFFDMELSDADQGMFKQPVTARGIAFLWNASYRFDLPNQWFIEPSIGGVGSRTEVDRFDTAGTFFTGGSVLPGSVQIDDINSLLGRASIRVGTTLVRDKLVLQPFVTGSIFHEFAGNVRTDMSTLSIGLPLEATSFTSREGTFGHIGVGLAGTILDTGWLGYVRGDYRFGENIEGISVNAGLRYQFTPDAGQAMGLKDGGGYAPEAQGYNWTGFYAGYNTGALWGVQDWLSFNFPGTTSPKYQGYLLGGQIGYDWQVGHLVLGVEADYSLSNAEGGGRCHVAANFLSCGTEVDNLALVTGRIGLAHQRALYYVKGGLAVGEVTARETFNDPALAGALVVFKPSETQTGWALGGGMEYALTDRWSVKGEWLHFDLGSETFTIDNSPDTVRISTTGNIARIGVNYRFGHSGEDDLHAMK